MWNVVYVKNLKYIHPVSIYTFLPPSCLHQKRTSGIGTQLLPQHGWEYPGFSKKKAAFVQFELPGAVWGEEFTEL